ncbi:MAG: hypothetical protein HOJ85_09905 [Ilumatobacter sp.]|jgi:hypothetical protein|uniref:hypothetical protein n=1 Tax=Ilumatobacter sp. TaxID=1967498 RepID=UPI001D3F7271|nr:hypothetical protein [Ilumatobacter sp.]MBT5276613.1 hypothetical protein [Ilumatobacter sp.]MBT5554065.1 hypothetical protein [Ilumatobacter sp.]MBT5865179.1 hypothetical protein [Ilumatobacter sp.]MBT7431034.1 hypothetical protein [Ilumatobacter sp.]
MIAKDSRFANGAATSIGGLPHRDAAAAAAFAIGEFEIATIPSLPNVAGMTAAALATNELDDSSFDGLHAFLTLGRLVNLDGEPITWHLPGPLSVGVSLCDAGLEPAEAFALAGKVVGSKLVEIAAEVSRVLPNSPQLVMIDEPALADLMRPDFPIPPDHAVDVMSSAMAALPHDVVAGIHCNLQCDIATMLASGPAVISVPVADDLVDWAGYIDRFLDDGGVIAWGVVPTGGPIAAGADRYWRALSDVWCELVRRGCDPVALRRQSMVTPGGGLEAHAVSVARRLARLTAEVAKRVRDQSNATRFALGA